MRSFVVVTGRFSFLWLAVLAPATSAAFITIAQRSEASGVVRTLWWYPNQEYNQLLGNDCDPWCRYHLYRQRRRRSFFLQVLPRDPDTGNKPSIRFSGIDLDSNRSFTSTNPVDYLLSLITSDIGSIALGFTGLLLLLVGRLLLGGSSGVEGLEEETRSNLLAVFACGAVLLNGISKLDVTSALAETVPLTGTDLGGVPLNLTSANKTSTLSMDWFLESLLVATPAKSGVLLQKNSPSSPWEVLALAGVVPREWSDSENPMRVIPDNTPILDRFLSGTAQETYLPTLQALPGKTEFTYLPDNSQAALLLPVRSEASSKTTVLVLGSNQARSFTPRNVAWCQTVVSRLGTEMKPLTTCILRRSFQRLLLPCRQ
jgi:hypothetical protein